jgi:hypothetical protein
LPRHARTVDKRSRTVRFTTLTVVWIGGLAAGFLGLLGVAARYGCAVNDDALACRGSGTMLGVLIVIAVVGVVTLVTVLSHERPPRRVLFVGGAGLVALLGCFLAARGLLDTV